VLTPFCHGTVDIASLECQLRRELSGGVQGLLVLGTLGEGQYVNAAERSQVIATAVRVACGAVPVVVGIHTGDLHVARAQMLQAKELGAAAVLVKFTDHPHAKLAEVLSFYGALGETCSLPIFYYHYPDQTGVKLKPEEMGAILGLPGIAGVKESTLDLREMEAHIRLAAGTGKVIVSSTALLLTQFLDLGGQGFWCPEAVLFPGPTVAACHAYQAGNRDEARSIQSELFAIAPIMTGLPAPPAVVRTVFMAAEDHHVRLPMMDGQPQARLKAALNCLGVPTAAEVKCPLPALGKHERRRVERAARHARAIDWSLAGSMIPPEPPAHGIDKYSGGLLLKTGALQLGPGVGRDLLRTQGDGPWGF
jgi:4-hydroxy-tetrahydrodipicolinate synthase